MSLNLLRLKLQTLKQELDSGDYTDAQKAEYGRKLQEARLWISGKQLAGSAIVEAVKLADEVSDGMKAVSREG